MLTEMARAPVREIPEGERCPHSRKLVHRDECSSCVGAKPRRVKSDVARVDMHADKLHRKWHRSGPLFNDDN
jgi:hypothetical protein